MRFLTFRIRCSFECEDGSIFGFTFSESQWCLPDADGTLTDNGWIVYTPPECIDAAIRTFYEGLTETEKEQAGKSFRFEARQVQECR